MIILGCFGVPPFTETPKWLKWLINGVYLLLTSWDIGMILQAHPWRLIWLAMDNEPGLKMYFPRYMGIFCRYFSLPEAHKRNTKPHWTELLNNICEQNWFETSWFWSWKWLPPWKLTQISKIAIERRYGTFFQTIILGIYVKFPGCIYILYFSYKTFWDDKLRISRVDTPSKTLQEESSPRKSAKPQYAAAMISTRGWLGYIGDEILPGYIGILIRLYKDPY